jgi:hypothetical protein
MLKTLPLSAAILCSLSAFVSAAPESYCLVATCKNEGAVAEIYAPQRICNAGTDAFLKFIKKSQRGYYALDLNEAGKGKPLEPVNLKAAAGSKGVEVDQFTRGLPAATIPAEGGTVSFDHRFAQDMVCTPIFQTGTGAHLN